MCAHASRLRARVNESQQPNATWFAAMCQRPRGAEMMLPEMGSHMDRRRDQLWAPRTLATSNESNRVKRRKQRFSFQSSASRWCCCVRTHPGLVEAAVLAAHAEGLDGRRRLLSHQQGLLQLDLLLQLHQHGGLHAVSEGHATHSLPLPLLLLLALHSNTHLETMRPICRRQRQTCRGSLCSTEAKEGNSLRSDSVKKQPPPAWPSKAECDAIANDREEAG